MDENEKRMFRVCFTGHRPEKLVRSSNDIKKDLETEIYRAISDGFNVFISGMARGVDIWAAQIVLKIRNEGTNIRLICACPYDGFEFSWNRYWQGLYKEVLTSADYVKYVCGEYSRSCFMKRNKWMVLHSARVISVFNGETGGTKNTIDFAIKAGVPVVYISG